MANEGTALLQSLTSSMLFLRDAVGMLASRIDELNGHVAAQNSMLARYSYALDRMLEVQRGNPDATPPEPGRAPTLQDWIDAVDRFDADFQVQEEERSEPSRPEPEFDIVTASRGLPPLPVMPKPSP